VAQNGLKLGASRLAPPGWRELTYFNDADLRALGWVETRQTGKPSLWTHPERPGDTFTERQAEQIEQVKASKRFAAENS